MDRWTKFEHFYEQDGPRHSSREKAVSHGWNTFGHDDFNIGHVRGDRLIWFGWMSDEIGESDEDFAEIAKQLELVPDRQKKADAVEQAPAEVSAEIVDTVAARLLRIKMYGQHLEPRYDVAARKQWDNQLDDDERQWWRDEARALLAIGRGESA